MKTVKDIMSYVTGGKNDVLMAVIHYKMTDGKVQILKAYELNEPSEYEAIDFIYNYDDGSYGHLFKNDIVKAVYLKWRIENFDKIVIVNNVMDLMCAGNK